MELSNDKDIPVPAKISLVDWVRLMPFVSCVWIFGSRARGTHKLDSDLDVAVEFDPIGDEDQATTWICDGQKWESELQKHIHIKVHLWRYHPYETPTIKKGLEESSVLVYQREVGAAAN